jgi:hypothetical protein
LDTFGIGGVVGSTKPAAAMRARTGQALNSDRQYVIFSSIYSGLIGIFLLVWLIVVWGVFRQINALARWRSFAAFIIAGILGTVALAATDLMGFAGLFPFFLAALFNDLV